MQTGRGQQGTVVCVQMNYANQIVCKSYMRWNLFCTHAAKITGIMLMNFV